MIKLYKGTNDKSDLQNYLKQIITSLDPFLKKVLFFTDIIQYQKVKQSKFGLGKVIETLDKLDPKDNRYKKESKSASFYKFGKHIHKVYTKRNEVTHEAKYWGKQQINDCINSALVVYIYTIMEYYTEIQLELQK